MSAPGHAFHLFVARADNDLDHLTPVMWALLEAGHAVRLLSRDPLRDLTRDYRTAALAAFPAFSAVSVFDGESGATAWRRAVLQRAYWRLVRASEREQAAATRVATSVAASRISARLTRHRDRWERDVDPAGLLRWQGRQAATLTFDHHADAFTRRSTAVARAARVPVLSLPHSIGHLASGRVGGRFQLREARQEPGTHALDIYDYVVVPNARVAERFVRDGLDRARLRVLGSARFSPQWMPVLRRMMPSVTLPPRRDGRSRVLLMTSKFLEHVNRDEVFRVMRAIVDDGRFDLWIKPHTRTAFAGLPADVTRQAYVAPGGVPTFALVEAADLVLFWGTSAVYDAFALDRPVILLRYLFALELDLDAFLQEHSAASRDGLARLMDRASAPPAAASSPARDRILEDLVLGGHADPMRAAVALYQELAA